MKNKILLLTCLLLLALFALPETSPAQGPDIVMETSMGTLRIRLNDEKAPETAANFRRYVREGFYDNTIFHRVIPGFVIQGGGFAPGMRQKTTHPAIRNEAANGLKNRRATLSMARTRDIHSASSQFFINVANNTSLDHTGTHPDRFGYAVFGEVIEGMEVVDRIVAVRTGSKGGHRDVPVEDVLIIKAYEE